MTPDRSLIPLPVDAPFFRGLAYGLLVVALLVGLAGLLVWAVLS